MIISPKITILGKRLAENGVAVLIYGENNCRLKKYGDGWCQLLGKFL